MGGWVASVTVRAKGWSQRIAVVVLGKSELGLTPETDEQCVRGLWFMDRTHFSGWWGFHWNKRSSSLLGND